jgi:chromosomal replication initiation ATPase DnaA
LEKLVDEVKKEKAYILKIMDEYSALIAEFYGFDKEKVFHPSRSRKYFDSRSFVFFIMVMMYGIKKSTIERITGWDHASILHGINDLVRNYSLNDDLHDFMNKVIGREDMKKYIDEIKKRKRTNLS